MREQSSEERREQHLSTASQRIVQQRQELGRIPQEKRGVPALSLLHECMETIFVELSEYLTEEHRAEIPAI